MGNILLLLTACVDPKGMKFTALQDKGERLQQYLAAIKYYYDKTKYRILIVENTNYDMSRCLPDDKSRIEFLTFEGNNYNKDLGKGFGEALIMKYAADHSQFYSQAETIIKITGRDKVLNVNTLIKEIRNASFVYTNIITCDGRLTCLSRFVAFPKKYLDYIFLPNSDKINDSKNYYFEDLIFDTSKGILRQFCHPILTETVSGTTGERIHPSLSLIIKAPIIYWIHKLGYYRYKF